MRLESVFCFKWQLFLSSCQIQTTATTCKTLPPRAGAGGLPSLWVTSSCESDESCWLWDPPALMYTIEEIQFTFNGVHFPANAWGSLDLGRHVSPGVAWSLMARWWYTLLGWPCSLHHLPSVPSSFPNPHSSRCRTDMCIPYLKRGTKLAGTLWHNW